MSVIFAVLGMTILPIVGGAVAAGLGAAAVAAIRRQPERWDGRGLAHAGFGLGLAFGVVPLAGFLAYASVVAHRGWATVPLLLVSAYGVLVIAVAARASRAGVAVSGLGVVGGLLALLAAVLLAYGAAVLFTHLIRDLVRFVFNDTKCAITHGGGTGTRCTRR